MEKRVGLLCIALLMLTAFAATAQQPFADVSPDHWAYGAVSKLQEEGVVAGYPDGYFRGDRSLSRYEFAQAIFRALEYIEEKMPGGAAPVSDAALKSRVEELEGKVKALEAKPGGGLTSAQEALLRRLEREFAPELKALRSDYDALASRVAALEEKPEAKGPKIKVSGDISVRGGLYGTSLKTGTGESTGYPYPWFVTFATVGQPSSGWYAPYPYGAINISLGDQPYFSIPVSDALKDAYKANDFLTMQTRVAISGQLNENVDTLVRLRANPRGNNVIPEYESVVGEEVVVDGAQASQAFSGWADLSPNLNYSDGIMDTVQVEEAWVRAKTRLVVPLTVTAGKQYFARGLGLMANNDQFPLKALRTDFQLGRGIELGALVGMLDREAFNAQSTGNLAAVLGMYEFPTTGQDNYNLYWVDIPLWGDWALGFNWLGSGFARERAWSTNLSGQIFGLNLAGEFAELDRMGSGAKPGSKNDAWLVKLGKKQSGFAWCASYGELGPDYAFDLNPSSFSGWDPVGPLAIWTSGVSIGYLNLPLSLLHPYAEYNPHDINWVDRPVFLDATNVARGWELKLNFDKLLGKKTPLEIRYYDGDAYNPNYLGWLFLTDRSTAQPTRFRDADSVWTVKISHDIAQDVTASLLYGRREAKNVLSPYGTSGYLDDAVQVVRGEVAVAF